MKVNEARNVAKILKRPPKWHKLYFGYYTERDLNILSKFLPRRGRILDVGGGIGRISIPLAKTGYDITLVDLVEDFLQIAKNNAKKEGIEIKTEKGDIRKLIYKDNEFDIVLAMRDVLNYCCDDYEKAFSELVRVCKRNGIIVVSCGTRYRMVLGKGIMEKFGLKSLYNFAIKGKPFPTGEGFNHINFTVEELKSLFKKFNIKILKISGDSIILPTIRSSATRILRNRNNVKILKKIDEILSKNEGNLNFFDHIIVIGKK
jgi:ubiquinone/menaquinone biosynthesis C-methylase UbiE